MTPSNARQFSSLKILLCIEASAKWLLTCLCEINSVRLDISIIIWQSDVQISGIIRISEAMASLTYREPQNLSISWSNMGLFKIAPYSFPVYNPLNLHSKQPILETPSRWCYTSLEISLKSVWILPISLLSVVHLFVGFFAIIQII